MNHTPISGKRICLCPKSRSDAPQDYIWGKDAELAALNGLPTIRGTFVQYVTQFKSTQDDARPSRVWLSIKTISDGCHIGNCTIYDIDWDNSEAQLGITIGDRCYWGQGYGEDAFKTLAGYTFHNIGMRRLHLKTQEQNMRAIKCFQKCGFTPCGSLLKANITYILMQLCFEDYVSTQLR
ncbi:MAG: GNAT family N-acetyltransferase [Dehalococcoidia bacterium]|nr:GNAT family N-acetyltransferase [Dehalococcoidia bacterium]